MKHRAIGWIIVGILVFVFFLALPRTVLFYTDWLWFKEVGYTSVFWRGFWAQIFTGLVFGGLFFAIVYGNCLAALRSAPRASWHEYERRPRLDIAYEWQRLIDRWLPLAALAICLLVGYGVATATSARWFSTLLALNPMSFHRTDPVFGRDLSYYVFQLPLMETFQSYLSGAIILSIVFAGAIHLLVRSIRTFRGVPEFAPHVKIHLAILLGSWLLVRAWGYRLQMFDLLYSQNGVVFGATYADVHARLFALWILLVIAAIAGIITLLTFKARGFVIPLGALVVLIISSILAWAYPAAVQQFKVTPTEQTMEAPFIDRNIKATRFGFNLDSIKDSEFPPLQSYTAETLKTEAPTIQNVRLWDHRPLLDVFRQKQQLQTYYEFNDIDIDRYMINGQYRQAMLSAREINFDKLPGGGWQNQRISYTHGYGMVLAPVNEVTGEGDPRLLIDNIPPVSEAGLPKVKQPGIYYGEGTTSDQFSLVRTNIPENDYPLTGRENATTTYSGTGGVPIGGMLSRLAFSIRFSDYNLLLSNNITEKSRIIYQRSIVDRVQAIAPFLAYDHDPYLVLGEDGKQYWIQDAYTLTNRLPYSQPHPVPWLNDASINYIRNSVKVVIDAYNGTTTFYVADTKDPLLGSLKRVFPGFFVPMSELPTNLAQHIRYPEGMFNLQARVNTIYHMTKVQTFYRKSDKWQIAREKAGKQALIQQQAAPVGESSEGEAMEAYYTLIRLPNEKEAEFLLMIPFTLTDRPTMVAWMAARCDPEHYGEIITFEFPRQRQVYGPIQIEASIDQHPEISKLLTWWGSGGSDVIRGNLLVIPLGSSLLYVEPLFLKAQVSAIPQLKLVVVGRQEGESLQVSFAPSLDQALAIAVGSAEPLNAEDINQNTAASTTPAPTQPSTTSPSSTTTSAVPSTPTPAGKATANKALAEYRAAQARLRDNDFAGYERELKKMETTLKELAKMK